MNDRHLPIKYLTPMSIQGVCIGVALLVVFDALVTVNLLNKDSWGPSPVVPGGVTFGTSRVGEGVYSKTHESPR